MTIVADLATDTANLQLPDCPVVVWSAGYDRSSGCTRRQLWINGLEKLLRSLPDNPQPRRLILTSTTGVYGDACGSTVDECTPPQPVQEGGIVCLEAEHLLQAWCSQHRDIRPSSCVSPASTVHTDCCDGCRIFANRDPFRPPPTNGSI
ncbi:MAG UNVERIFIED_CONTAM: hypothetical protein LVR18_25395 [Planctomycetaceae bacterium]